MYNTGYLYPAVIHVAAGGSPTVGALVTRAAGKPLEMSGLLATHSSDSARDARPAADALVIAAGSSLGPPRRLRDHTQGG